MFTNLDGWIFFPFKNFFFLQIFQEKSSFFAASWYKKSWIWVTVCSCKVKWIEEIWKRMTLEVSKTSTVKEIRNFFKFYLANFFSLQERERKKIKKMCSHSKRCTFLQNVRPSELGHFLLYDQTHVVGCRYGITRMTMPDPIHSKLHTYFYYSEHCIDGTAGITRSGHSIISGSFYPSTLLLKGEISWKLLLASGCHLTLAAFSESIHFILRPWPLVLGRIFVFHKSGSYFCWSSNVLQ